MDFQTSTFWAALRKRCNENMEEHEKLTSLNNVSSSFPLIILSPFNTPVKLTDLSFLFSYRKREEIMGINLTGHRNKLPNKLNTVFLSYSSVEVLTWVLLAKIKVLARQHFFQKFQGKIIFFAFSSSMFLQGLWSHSSMIGASNIVFFLCV